jgi:hypothetical protein
MVKELVDLSKKIRIFLKDLPKAKAAKIIKIIIEFVGKIPNSKEIQIEFCLDTIKWANDEKRLKKKKKKLKKQKKKKKNFFKTKN